MRLYVPSRPSTRPSSRNLIKCEEIWALRRAVQPGVEFGINPAPHLAERPRSGRERIDHLLLALLRLSSLQLRDALAVDVRDPNVRAVEGYALRIHAGSKGSQESAIACAQLRDAVVAGVRNPDARPSNANPAGLVPTVKVPRRAPSLARNFITWLLLEFETQAFVPSNATPPGLPPTLNVP